MEAFYKEAIATNRPLVTTNYVLVELIALLTARARASRGQILALLTQIRRLPYLHIVHVDLDLDAAAWAVLEQHVDKTWSLVDASSFVVMRRFSIYEAFTTDQHFVQAGFVRVPHR